MSDLWQLQEAKNKFSSLVERAQNDGPQVVTKHGKEAVVVLSVDDYNKLTRPKKNLAKFIRKSPLSGVDIDISRDKTAPSDVAV
jgi:prevent-host-death family protein